MGMRYIAAAVLVCFLAAMLLIEKADPEEREQTEAPTSHISSNSLPLGANMDQSSAIESALKRVAEAKANLEAQHEKNKESNVTLVAEAKATLEAEHQKNNSSLENTVSKQDNQDVKQHTLTSPSLNSLVAAQVGCARNQRPANSSHLQLCDKSVVYWCGFGQFRAKIMFPERVVHQYKSGLISSPDDVLIAGNACRDGDFLGFKGKVAYFDHEGGMVIAQTRLKGISSERINYFGPHPTVPVRTHLKVFHAAIAAYQFSHPNELLRTRAAINRPRFMMWVNSNCRPTLRNAVFDALVEFCTKRKLEKPVAGGKCHGSHPELSEWRADRDKRAGNAQRLSSFRFSLVMENAVHSGYVTEKIVQAFLAGNIPVYLGTSEVFELFNKDAIVFLNPDNLKPAMEKIAYLEGNKTAYDEMASLPILADGRKTLEEHFSFSKDVGDGKLRDRIVSFLDLRCPERLERNSVPEGCKT